MIMWNRCKSCGGVYPPIERDGMVYYHACPPSRLYPGLGRKAIANRRNENVMSVDPAGNVVIISEGLGIDRDVQAPELAEA